MRRLTQPVLGLKLAHAVRVEEVVEGHAKQVSTRVAQVPLTTAQLEIYSLGVQSMEEGFIQKRRQRSSLLFGGQN